MKVRGPRNTGLWLLLTLVGISPAQAGEWRIDEEASLLAVVTHKAGLGARLAHNHLVAATSYTTELQFDSDTPQSATFTLLAPVAGLRVDVADLQGSWYPRLEALGILSEPFSEVNEKTQAKIRQAMLSPKQLDGEHFPTLEARLLGVAAKVDAQAEFPYTLRLLLTLKNVGVEAPIAARLQAEGGHLKIEAYGVFKFSDFGIKPYSAALGAVRNEDEFHLYLHLEARGVEP